MPHSNRDARGEDKREPILAFCRHAGLVRADEEPSMTPLTGGVSSDIWLLRSGGRQFCVKRALPKLRVAAAWHVPVERNRYEACWLRAAAAIEPEAVPEVIAEDAALGMFAMDYLPAEAYPRWKDQLLGGAVDPTVAAAVGGVLGRLHAGFARDPGGPDAFDTTAIFDSIRVDPYLRATAAVHPHLAPRLLALADLTLRTRHTVIHGDVSPKNILVGPHGPVFLDAECAWYGDPAFDLAFCLNHMLLKAVAVPGCATALASSFEALSGHYLAEVDWESPEALEGRAAGLLPGLFLARVDGKSPVEYLTGEADRARVRRVATALLEDPPARLACIAAAWQEALDNNGAADS